MPIRPFFPIRKPRLSLRLTMILLAVAAVVLGRAVNRARTQEEAVRAIKSVGGDVGYDWEFEPDGFRGIRPAPRWYHRWFGLDFFQNVYMVQLSGHEIGDEVMPHVAKLSSLHELKIFVTNITGRGLDSLKGHKTLERVLLPSTVERLDGLRGCTRLRRIMTFGLAVDDRGMDGVQDMKALEWLDLIDAKFGDAGASRLRGLDRLHRLCIPGSKITDAGMADLAGLTGITWLDLSHTAITDAGLVHLKSMRSLSWLDLSDTRVRGPGLAHLAGCTGPVQLNLKRSLVDDEGLSGLPGILPFASIELQETAVGDAGLEKLGASPRLGVLHLDKTRVTKQGVDRLKASRPNVLAFGVE